MRGWLDEFDPRVVLLVLLLLAFGAAMVHGASAYDSGNADPDAVGALPTHLVRIALAVAVCLFVSQVDYRVTARTAELGLIASIALLVMVGVGAAALGNAGIDRWVGVFGMVFQPAELAKVCLVLSLPAWIDRDPSRLREGPRRLLPLIALPVVVGALIVAQPNFGTALALCTIVATVLWVGGLAIRWVALGMTTLGGAAFVAFTHHPKLIARAEVWRNVLFRESADLHEGFQSYHAVMGLGNGGWFGVRPGEGITRFAFVPEPETDFVFAIAGEQMGFVGSLLLVIAYAMLVARALKIARASKDGQAYLTAVAIGTMIGVYALLNLAMVSGLVPVMGLPLPFVSRGGSALLTNMIAIGVLLNIGRNVRRGRRPGARWEAARA